MSERLDMGFEPKVLESIKMYRSRTRRDQFLVLTPFYVSVLLSVAVLIVTLLMREQISAVSTAGGRSGWSSLVTFYVKMAAGIATIVLVAGLGYKLFASARYARARFQLFVGEVAPASDGISKNKFINALEGAAIAAGVETPFLRVLDDPMANALAFEESDGGWHVGVTNGLLEADISVSEADAIMGHELAHLVIGENVSPPGIVDLEFQPSLLLLAFGTVSMAAVLLVPANMLYLGIVVLFILVVFAVLMVIYRSQSFVMKLLDLAHHHDDILADSIAAKITGDPASLKSAIQKIEALVRESGRVPGGTMLSRYMFVTPPNAPGDYVRFATEVAGEMLSTRRQPRTWFLFSNPVGRATLKVLDMESDLSRERLLNLDLIEQGRWRALEDWSRD